MNTITEVYKENFINSVINANKELFTYINHNLTSEDLEYSNKIGYGGDNSLNIDLKAENIFINHLSKYGNIYSEECGYINNDSDFTIIIDPLDGSDNFLSNLEYYGSSIALKYKDNTIAGFVCNLATGTLIYKAFDSEVYNISLNQRKIIKKDVSKFALFERSYKYPNISKVFSEQNIKFRNLGAAALSLSNARDYDFVLFLGEIREFDIAAALYICKDLHIFKTDNILLISENKHKFEIVKDLLKKNRL